MFARFFWRGNESGEKRILLHPSALSVVSFELELQPGDGTPDWPDELHLRDTQQVQRCVARRAGEDYLRANDLFREPSSENARLPPPRGIYYFALGDRLVSKRGRSDASVPSTGREERSSKWPKAQALLEKDWLPYRLVVEPFGKEGSQVSPAGELTIVPARARRVAQLLASVAVLAWVILVWTLSGLDFATDWQGFFTTAFSVASLFSGAALAPSTLPFSGVLHDLRVSLVPLVVVVVATLLCRFSLIVVDNRTTAPLQLRSPVTDHITTVPANARRVLVWPSWSSDPSAGHVTNEKLKVGRGDTAVHVSGFCTSQETQCALPLPKNEDGVQERLLRPAVVFGCRTFDFDGWRSRSRITLDDACAPVPREYALGQENRLVKVEGTPATWEPLLEDEIFTGHVRLDTQGLQQFTLLPLSPIEARYDLLFDGDGTDVYKTLVQKIGPGPTQTTHANNPESSIRVETPYARDHGAFSVSLKRGGQVLGNLYCDQAAWGQGPDPNGQTSPQQPGQTLTETLPTVWMLDLHGAFLNSLRTVRQSAALSTWTSEQPEFRGRPLLCLNSEQQPDTLDVALSASWEPTDDWRLSLPKQALTQLRINVYHAGKNQGHLTCKTRALACERAVWFGPVSIPALTAPHTAFCSSADHCDTDRAAASWNAASTSSPTEPWTCGCDDVVSPPYAALQNGTALYDHVRIEGAWERRAGKATVCYVPRGEVRVLRNEPMHMSCSRPVDGGKAHRDFLGKKVEHCDIIEECGPSAEAQ